MSELPEWIEEYKLFVENDGELDPDQYGHVFQALAIAWEALEKIETYGRPLEAPKASYAVCEINDLSKDAMRRIEELGK